MDIQQMEELTSLTNRIVLLKKEIAQLNNKRLMLVQQYVQQALISKPPVALTGRLV